MEAGGAESLRAAKARLARTPRTRARFTCDRVLDSLLFRFFVICLVVANTAVMMCEQHPMPLDLRELVDKSNLMFTLTFLAEMLLKLSVRGCEATGSRRAHASTCIPHSSMQQE